MKQVYKIKSFHNERGEAFTAIFCESLNELAIETSGEIVCTEQDAIEDVLSGTPWAGSEDLTFAESWPEMTDDQFKSMNSEGLHYWINAKEPRWAVWAGDFDNGAADWYRDHDTAFEAWHELAKTISDGDSAYMQRYDANGDPDENYAHELRRDGADVLEYYGETRQWA